MKNEEIFKKALTKAWKNGYRWPDYNVVLAIYVGEVNKGMDRIYEISTTNWLRVNDIIFSHAFAKAFWGEEEAKIEHQGWVQEYTGCPAWQYHLQQMVLEDDPIKYLEKFLL